MPSPSPCRHESSSAWRRSSRSLSGKAWKTISSIRWSMKRSLSAPDLPSPSSRSEAMRRKRWRTKTSKTHCREIPCCQCNVLGCVSGGGGWVISIKHQPTQSHTHASVPRCDKILSLCSQALEAVNTQLRELYPESEELFDVVLMTNNHANVGLRLINTINHHRELLIHMNNWKLGGILGFKTAVFKIFKWPFFKLVGVTIISLLKSLSQIW